MKLGKGFLLFVIFVFFTPFFVKMFWIQQYNSQPGRAVDYSQAIKLSGPNNESVEVFMISDSGDIQYASRVYGYLEISQIDFSKEIMILVSYTADSRDLFEVLRVREYKQKIYIDIRYEDVGFPRGEKGNRVTILISVLLSQLSGDIPQNAEAKLYVDVNTVYFQMFVVFDILFLIRIIFLVVKKRDLTFRESISFLKIE